MVQPTALKRYWAMKKGNHPSTDAMINQTIKSKDGYGEPQQPNRQMESGGMGQFNKRSEIMNRHPNNENKPIFKWSKQKGKPAPTYLSTQKR